MMNRSILARGAMLGLLITGLSVLADRMARAQLDAAVASTDVGRTRLIVQVAGAE